MANYVDVGRCTQLLRMIANGMSIRLACASTGVNKATTWIWFRDLAAAHEADPGWCGQHVTGSAIVGHMLNGEVAAVADLVSLLDGVKRPPGRYGVRPDTIDLSVSLAKLAKQIRKHGGQEIEFTAYMYPTGGVGLRIRSESGTTSLECKRRELVAFLGDALLVADAPAPARHATAGSTRSIPATQPVTAALTAL